MFQLSLSSIYAWTDSTIVLNWLIGNPRRFKTYVGNRVSYIADLISPEKWNHINGFENPADCASRGLFPSELLNHSLWWNGPTWLKLPLADWPIQALLPPNNSQEEERDITLHSMSQSDSPVIPLDRYSSFNHLKRITAWILRLFGNLCSSWLTDISPLHSLMKNCSMQNAIGSPSSKMLISKTKFKY